jgi:branched-subunit amino acid ABC-type transport system permease component
MVGMVDTSLKYFAPELGAFFIYALTMAVLLRYPRGILGRT